jgi:hypothetical protein
VAAVVEAAAAPASFDWRHPLYGIERWPPGRDNPVSLVVICEARCRAREARLRWEAETRN